MINKIRLAGVMVSDPDQARDFYAQTLGFTIQADHTTDNGHRWVEVVPPGAETAIALSKPYPGQESSIGGMTSVVFTTDDIESTYQELSGKGVSFIQPPQRQIWGDSMAIFADPDGNQFVLVDRK